MTLMSCLPRASSPASRCALMRSASAMRTLTRPLESSGRWFIVYLLGYIFNDNEHGKAITFIGDQCMRTVPEVQLYITCAVTIRVHRHSQGASGIYRPFKGVAGEVVRVPLAILKGACLCRDGTLPCQAKYTTPYLLYAYDLNVIPRLPCFL